MTVWSMSRALPFVVMSPGSTAAPKVSLAPGFLRWAPKDAPSPYDVPMRHHTRRWMAATWVGGHVAQAMEAVTAGACVGKGGA